MLKSKNFTLGVIVLIFIYEISTTLTSLKTNSSIYNVVNPVFWVVLAILMTSFIKGLYVKHKFKKDILQYSLIAVLSYVILYLVIGLFVGLGKNPYATNLRGVIYNLLSFGIVIIAKEYVRYKLINNVYEKDKIKIAFLISIVYVIIDFNFYRFFTNSYSIYYIYKDVSQRLLPCIVKNILFSYIAMKAGCLPSILYEIGIKTYFLCSPVLANTPWILNSIIDILNPFILYLYIRYVMSIKDVFKTKSKVVEFDFKEILVLVIIVVFMSLFTVGIFPIKPMSVLTASMEPGIHVGDMVLISRCAPNKIKVNDIVEYRVDDHSVIHRVIEINEIDNNLYFITKGDNNEKPDGKVIEQKQIVGKVICNVRYLGYPAVWLNSLQETPREEINQELMK